MKILQEGGTINNGMVFGSSYTPLDTNLAKGTTTASQSKGSDKTSDDGLLGSSLIKELLGKGITNDVNASMNGLLQIQYAYDNLSETEKTSRQGISLLNQMQTAAGKVNMLLRNANQFQAAQTKAVTKNAISELAVTSKAMIIQDSKGRIHQITPEQFVSLEDKENYRVLTNGELINEREYNMQLQGDVLSFEQLNNSTGFSDVQSQVKDIMASISLSKMSNTYDQYTDQTNKLQEGLQQLKVLSSQPIDNITITMEEESNESSAKKALEAMWSSLSDNSKTFLKQKAAISGYDINQLDAVAKSYLIQLISPKIVNNRTTKTDTDLGQSKSGQRGESSTGSDKTSLKFYDIFANDLVPREIVPLAPEGGQYQYSAPGAIYGPLRTQDQNPYKLIQLSQIPELSTITYSDAASFGGDRVLSNANQQGIAYNGESISRVQLPYRLDQNSHRMVPDFNMLPKYERQMTEIDKLTKTGRQLTIGEKQQIFIKNGFDAKDLNVNGEPNHTKDFQAIPVYVGETTYKLLDEKSQSLLMKDESEGQKQVMRNTFLNSKENALNNGDLFSKKDDVYRGMIYMPILDYQGVASGAINDGGMSIGDYKNRATLYQTKTGQINQALSTTYSIDLLNQMTNVRK